MEDHGSKHRRRLPLVLGAVALGAGVAVALIAGLRARRRKQRRAEPAEPAHILRLSVAELDDILRHLDVRSRVALLCSCRQLRTAVTAAPSLWADVSVHLRTLRALESFAAALAWAAPDVCRLRFTHPWLKPLIPTPASPLGRQLDAVDSAVLHADRVITAALARAAALETLYFTLGCDPISLAPWAHLASLRSLSLVAYAPLELPSALGAGLPALRELSVYEDLMLVAAGSGITLQPGCLPPALRQLELFVHFLRVLPPVVTEATQLAQLRICYRGAPQMVLPGLSRLTNLRELALWDFLPTQDLAQAVSSLPQLRRLDMSAIRQRWETFVPPSSVLQVMWEGVRGLAQSTSLQELALGRWAVLRRLPPEILRMRELRVLHLDGNPALQLEAPASEPEELAEVPAEASECLIEHLTLDIPTAYSSLPVLAAWVPALQRLRLSGARIAGSPTPTLEQLQAGLGEWLPEVEVELGEGPREAVWNQWVARERDMRQDQPRRSNPISWLGRMLGR